MGQKDDVACQMALPGFFCGENGWCGAGGPEILVRDLTMIRAASAGSTSGSLWLLASDEKRRAENALDRGTGASVRWSMRKGVAHSMGKGFK